MPDVGFKRIQTNALTHTRQESGSFKTSKFARKLGEFAIANDLAYVPRLPDNAVIGINPDENHSRESYVQAHNAAMDFTRQLPKGMQPGFFNPCTHVLVPIEQAQRRQTVAGLQTDQTPGPTPDLLDLEFMANKPQTVHTETPSRTPFPKARDTDAVRRHPSKKAFQAYLGVPREWQPAPYARDQGEGHELYKDTNNTQQHLPRIPSQLRATSRPSTSTAAKRTSDRHELFYSPPATFQEYPAFDTSAAGLQSTQTRPTTPYGSETPTSTTQRARCLTPAKSLRNPPTWNGPNHKATTRDGPPTKSATHQPCPPAWTPVEPRRLPLSFDGICTYSPKESTSPTTKYSTRRQITVHRQKTSQEIWQGQSQAQQKPNFEETQAEKLRAMQDAITREQQAVESAAFERRHAEHVKAMQDAIAADEMKTAARATKQAGDHLRGNARTFEPHLEEHRLRTRTHTQTQTYTYRCTSNDARAPKPTKPTQTATHMRPTARTFHTEQAEHTLRPRTRDAHQQTNNTTPSQSPAQARRPPTRSPSYTTTPTIATPDDRHWHPNPTAQTFECMNSAGAYAAWKRRGGSRE